MKFVFYRDVFGGWRWELRDEHGHVQDSQHSYDTREECAEAAAQATRTVAATSDESTQIREPIVLCVQPDQKLRETLQDALAGFQTVLASNALEAIRLVNSSIFDAYVVDYLLPGSSGIHLCRHIRRTDRNTPVCFYTAAVTEEQRKRAFSAGANAYVCASSGADVLRSELRTLLDVAESQSIRARLEEERAIQEELEKRVVIAIDRTEQARALAAQATERAAKALAYARFTQAGGTPAYFERWWPQTYASVSATHRTASEQRSVAGKR